MGWSRIFSPLGRPTRCGVAVSAVWRGDVRTVASVAMPQLLICMVVEL